MTEIKPIYFFSVMKATLFIESVTQLEETVCLQGERKKSLKVIYMKKNPLIHKFK